MADKEQSNRQELEDFFLAQGVQPIADSRSEINIQILGANSTGKTSFFQFWVSLEHDEQEIESPFDMVIQDTTSGDITIKLWD